MKRGKLKNAALWFISAFALTSVGSLTYATSRDRTHEEEKKHHSSLVSKAVNFAHDKDVDAYLTTIRQYMLTPPLDKRFGANRIETIEYHKLTSGHKDGYTAMENLGRTSTVRSFVVGIQPDVYAEVLKLGATKTTRVKLNSSNYRTSLVHTFPSGQKSIGRPSAIKVSKTFRSHESLKMFDNYHKLLAVVEKVKGIADKKGFETYSENVTIEGAKGWIMAKAVRAPDKSCYQCHLDIKKGQPIGHVIAAIFKKESK